MFCLYKLVQFIAYCTMLLYVCVFRRLGDTESGMMFSLALFASYRRAWNTFSLVPLQMLFLNMVIFMPFGALTAFFSRKPAPLTAGATWISFSLLIELLQLVLSRGLFELDDLFNNTLGALIGYCLALLVVAIIRKNKRTVAVCCGILGIPVVLLGIAGVVYSGMEYGNLTKNWTYRHSLANAVVTVDAVLSDKGGEAAVYYTPNYMKKSAEDFLDARASSLGIASQSTKTVSDATGWIRYYYSESISYSLGVAHNGGYTSYRDLSMYKKTSVATQSDENELRDGLFAFGIDVPDDAVFTCIETGKYVFTVAESADGETYRAGTIAVICRDGKIKAYDNDVLNGVYYATEKIRSPSDAFKDITDGKFVYEGAAVTFLRVTDCRLAYMLDSKGYIRPVYAYECVINGEDATLYADALAQ